MYNFEVSSLDREGARVTSRPCWPRRGRALRRRVEVSSHRKSILSPSFLSVGRIVCRENKQSTKGFTAPPHPTSASQHQKSSNDSRDTHPTLIALPISAEGYADEGPNTTEARLFKAINPSPPEQASCSGDVRPTVLFRLPHQRTDLEQLPSIRGSGRGSYFGIITAV